MTNATCEATDCDRAAYGAKPLCRPHWTRFRRTGEIGGYVRTVIRDPEVSFLERSSRVREDGCRIWTGTMADTGYGRISFNGKQEYAHRYAWTRAHGEIPEGKMVDHICHNRACVEVTHLRLVTNQENSWNRRGANPNSASGVRGLIHEGPNSWAAQAKRDGQIVRRFFSSREAALAAIPVLHRELYGAYAGTEVA